MSTETKRASSKETDSNADETKSVFADNPRLDRRIIEGMLQDRETLMTEMKTKILELIILF